MYWDEIKNRVELKVADEIDINDFIPFANEAMDELQDISYIKGPKIRYGVDNDTNKMRSENDSVSVTIAELRILPATELEMDFYHTIGDGNLSVVVPVGVEWNSVGENLEMSNKISFTIADTVSDSEVVSITVHDPIFEDTNNLKNKPYRYKIAPPENLNSVIKIKVKSKDYGYFISEPVSLRNIDAHDENQSKTMAMHIIKDDVIEIYSDIEITEMFLQYFKNMKPLKLDRALSVTKVEFGDTFLNVLVYLITNKWMENYLGVSSNETLSHYQKFAVLKEEYESTVVSKRRSRVQKSINTWS